MKYIEGIHVIDKPYGMSSQHAVQIVKYWARRKTDNTKIKVGHGGTLDPLATGVLVVAVGRRYTKKIDAVVASEKEYIAEIYLGKTSTTDDAEGEKTIVDDVTVPSHDDVTRVLQKFIGAVTQIPPAYSAIKIDRQEAYKRVRRGEQVAMKPRVVQITQIDILSYTYPHVRVRVLCGKGTYIRSLARDVGDVLGTGAYLASLVRTRVGDFALDAAADIDQFRMRIAVHASELDEARIDGTRVYLKEICARLCACARDDLFMLYHQDTFNTALAPPERNNCTVKTIAQSPLWTQTRFSWRIFRDCPDVVWMPLHNAPLILRKKTTVVVTIHDLAFKKFPETFPMCDVWKLRFLTRLALRRADHIVAVSHATKKDILTYFPHVKDHHVTVIHHGVNHDAWQHKSCDTDTMRVRKKYGVDAHDYIIHVGAIQPRKNIIRLIDAFARIKKTHPHVKLLLVGGRGWLWEDIEKHAQKSVHAHDIIFTGNIPFHHVRILMQQASVSVLPTLYEGFGLPGLEAMAAGVPVVAARNSSLPEILGSAAEYCDAKSSASIAQHVCVVLCDKELQRTMKERGAVQSQKFTWDKSAKKLLSVLRETCRKHV